MIAEPDTELFVSDASVWELLAKIGRGKLLLAGVCVDVALQEMQKPGAESVPVRLEQTVASANLNR